MAAAVWFGIIGVVDRIRGKIVTGVLVLSSERDGRTMSVCC